MSSHSTATSRGSARLSLAPLARTVVAAATLAALAACADSSRLVAPASTGASPADRAPSEFNSRHVFHTREYFAREDASNGAARYARSTSGSGTGISYHGGPVLLTGTNVAAVYWGSPGYNNLPTGHGAGSADGSLLGTFLRALGGSAYFNINHSYTNGSGTAITNAVTYTQYWNNTGTPSASPTDADMVAMLQAGLTAGAITYDSHTVYAIFTGTGVNLGGGFGSQYCAYHTHGTVTVNGVAKTILYAAMPYNAAYPTACTSQYAAANGTLDPAADAEVNTLAHEVEETTTDMMGTAWYDSRGYENADKCAWTWGTVQTAGNGGKYNVTFGGTNFLIQQNWVNAGSGGCALSY